VVENFTLRINKYQLPRHFFSSTNIIPTTIMDCFHDFCLACDKESTGPYCSQACRLADMERANASTSAPSSPTSPSIPAQSRVSWPSASSSGYVISPAYNFTQKPGSQSSLAQARPGDSYFMRTPSQQQSSHALTPSSSRTSLSSTTSDGTVPTGGISQQARLELQDYFSSFGQAKVNSRRPSVK
jgi:hypothetical protein